MYLAGHELAAGVQGFLTSKQNYPELQDVTIICDNEEEVYAHKCVLVARSEYFFSMFNSSENLKNIYYIKY